jgi:hypothetical protein
VFDDVGFGSNLFLTGSLSGLSSDCNLDYTIVSCGYEVSNSITECDDLIFIVPVNVIGPCSIDLTLTDNVDEGEWSGNIARVWVDTSNPTVNPVSPSEGLVFEPSPGSFTESEDLINSVESGVWDDYITGLITAGVNNSGILTALLLSIVGVSGLVGVNSSVLDRVKNYIKGLRFNYHERNGWCLIDSELNNLGLPNPNCQTKTEIITTLNLLMNDLAVKEYYFNTYQNNLNTHSTFVEPVFSGVDVSEARSLYEVYLNALLNNPSIQVHLV